MRCRRDFKRGSRSFSRVQLISFIRALGLVPKILPVALKVNGARSRLGPRVLVKDLRALGASCETRSTSERRQLQRAIHFVDRLFLSGPNCYRRALIEIAMDAGAAREPLHMGLLETDVPGSGHAWLGSQENCSHRYQVEFTI